MAAISERLALRRLDQIVRSLFRADQTSLSGMQHGRLAVELRRSMARLKRLSRDDPKKEFWDVLQQTILKTLKYISRGH
jgi:hypothetical protein